MKRYKNLILVGTSHIAQESLNAVKKLIEEEDPEVIGVELDKKRAAALLMQKKSKIRVSDIGRVGLKGWIFALLGAWAEQKLGETIGMKPGQEMRTAIVLAKQKHKRISFIDQDIEITLRKLSSGISWKEKWNFFVDIVKAPFARKKVEFDLRTVPDEKVISKMIKEVKKRYPNVYRVLIIERNEVMGRNIAKLMARFPDKKIIAFVGAGHETELLELVKKNLEQGVVYSVTVG